MEWIRRRARWPRVVALFVLFGLTVSAPRCWRWLRDHGPASPAPAALAPADVPVQAAAHRAPAEAASSEPAPPALATAPTSLLEDDYALVDEPLPAAQTADVRILSNQIETMESMTPLATSSGPLVLPREETQPQPGAAPGRPAPPAPAVPTDSEPDLTQLLAVREALGKLFAQVQNYRQTTLNAQLAPMPRVVVSSETDRLAVRLQRISSEPTVQDPAATAVAEQSPVAPRQTAPPAQPAAKPLLRFEPAVLTQHLQRAADAPLRAPWAAEALALLPTLTDPTTTAAEAREVLTQFERIAAAGLDDALQMQRPAEQRIAIRAARSLARRLPIWRAVVEEREAGPISVDPIISLADDDGAALLPLLNEFAQLTADSEAGAAWREYLLLDQLAALASVGGTDHAATRRIVARQVLDRIASTELTPEQQAFLASGPAAGLVEALRPWATGSVSMAKLAALVERYELRAAQRDADAIAEIRARLTHSGNPARVALAGELDRLYRNGNMRLAITGDLLNRLTPQPPASNTPVHDRVAGVDVRGRARTSTKLAVSLQPDPHEWKFGLEATGTVQSQTYSKTWPARVKNHGKVGFEARKVIALRPDGVRTDPAEARTVENHSSLVGIDSKFDPLPLVGPLVENYAREKNQERRPRALAQVRNKVQREARARLDRETESRLAEVEAKFRESVLAPLDKVAIALNPLEMYTTDQRAVMRMRMAAGNQLGAHTPRPSAPGDSLASIQLHESALNNASRGLGLDGKTFTSLELYETLAQRLGRTLTPPDADFPSRAKVTFAPTDAVRLRCEGDRIELVLTIAELAHGRDRIRDVEVHAFFRPVVEGLQLKLVRDDSLQFNGRRLLTGPRIVLHSVFGKMLPKDQEIVLLAPQVEGDPRFEGLMVTQVVIEDGWLALALGPEHPERTAWRSEAAESR